MNEYKVLSTIGEGAHGIVLKAKHKGVLERIVALKKITMKKVVKEGIPLQVIREIKALQFVEHENVVQLFDVFPHGISFVLVFEFMPSNLWEILHAHTLKGSQAKCYMKMILKGLDYLHTNHILHRDLKPANLLINPRGVLKIGDFGLCRLFFKGENIPYSHQVATRWYRAPELLYGARYYDEGVDLWAAGVIFAEMVRGHPLFPGDNDIDQLYMVVSLLGTPDDTWPLRTELPDYKKISFKQMDPIPLKDLIPTDIPKCRKFLGKFLLYDSSKRISAKDALRDKFFESNPFPCLVKELPVLPPPSYPFLRRVDLTRYDSTASTASASSSSSELPGPPNTEYEYTTSDEGESSSSTLKSS